MNCPSCKSENTQTIKMMCLSGSSSSAATAIGINSSFDLGVAKINSNVKTTLVNMYDPGNRPNVAFEVGFLAFGALILIAGLVTSTGIGIFFGLALVGGGFLRFTKESQALDTYKSKIDNYERGWICHKCGDTWNP
jgi:hypothetical protein